MKKIIALLIFTILLSVSVVRGGTALLGWTAPTTNEDGSELTDLAGYRIYWSENQGGPYENFVWVGDRTQADLDDSEWDGKTICFVATAMDHFGNESEFSNEVCEDFPVAPLPEETNIPNPPILSLR